MEKIKELIIQILDVISRMTLSIIIGGSLLAAVMVLFYLAANFFIHIWLLKILGPIMFFVAENFMFIVLGFMGFFISAIIFIRTFKKKVRQNDNED